MAQLTEEPHFDPIGVQPKEYGTFQTEQKISGTKKNIHYGVYKCYVHAARAFDFGTRVMNGPTAKVNMPHEDPLRGVPEEWINDIRHRVSNFDEEAKKELLSRARSYSLRIHRKAEDPPELLPLVEAWREEVFRRNARRRAKRAAEAARPAGAQAQKQSSTVEPQPVAYEPARTSRSDAFDWNEQAVEYTMRSINHILAISNSRPAPCHFHYNYNVREVFVCKESAPEVRADDGRVIFHPIPSGRKILNEPHSEPQEQGNESFQAAWWCNWWRWFDSLDESFKSARTERCFWSSIRYNYNYFCGQCLAHPLQRRLNNITEEDESVIHEDESGYESVEELHLFVDLEASNQELDEQSERYTETARGTTSGVTDDDDLEHLHEGREVDQSLQVDPVQQEDTFMDWLSEIKSLDLPSIDNNTFQEPDEADEWKNFLNEIDELPDGQDDQQGNHTTTTEAMLCGGY